MTGSRSHQVRHGLTMGGPITLNVTNMDHQKWLEIMNVAPVEEKKKNLRKITKPRPGHADLVGGIKYRFDDLRNSLERSSARETTMRVAVGAVAKRILEEIGLEVASHIVNLGGIEICNSRESNCFRNQKRQVSRKFRSWCQNKKKPLRLTLTK